jgi:hypothetical protein
MPSRCRSLPSRGQSRPTEASHDGLLETRSGTVAEDCGLSEAGQHRRMPLGFSGGALPFERTRLAILACSTVDVSSERKPLPGLGLTHGQALRDLRKDPCLRPNPQPCEQRPTAPVRAEPSTGSRARQRRHPPDYRVHPLHPVEQGRQGGVEAAGLKLSSGSPVRPQEPLRYS